MTYDMAYIASWRGLTGHAYEMAEKPDYYLFVVDGIGTWVERDQVTCEVEIYEC